MKKALETNKKVIRYEVDLFADGSEIETMTKKELLEFAELQATEWYDENTDQAIDEKYAKALKLADKVVKGNYKLKSIDEVELLFSLPATTIPFEVVEI